MKTLKPVLIISAVIVALQLTVTARGYCSGDPWYSDMDWHWSAPYVRVLWEEGVTDGIVVTTDYYTRAYFLPNSQATRAQFVTLMAKVFQLQPVYPAFPSYPDVPSTYQMLPGKPAWAWIEATLSAGVSVAPAGSFFYPEASLTREDAVQLLIVSLDLGEVAEAMTNAEVVSWLTRFWDGMRTTPGKRNYMACAIKYGIIKGYEDGSLRPLNAMLRAEAATVVYRSCLIRVSALSATFSPDGDLINDTITFNLGYLKNRGISGWQMSIQDQWGNEVASFNREGKPGAPPNSIVWDGKNASGTILQPGVYYYQAMVRDRQNRQFFSVRKPINLILHNLSASLSPEQCQDGDILVLWAETQPAALSVEARLDNGKTVLLAPAGSRGCWSTYLPVGKDLATGLHQVLVVARFEETSRQAPLSFRKLSNLWIVPSIRPNPALPGQEVTFACQGSPILQSVTAQWMGSTFYLAQRKDNEWTARTTIGFDVPEGKYPVIFTGKDQSDTVSAEVELEISKKAVRDLMYLLVR